jgi:hypothetical protein
VFWGRVAVAIASRSISAGDQLTFHQPKYLWKVNDGIQLL